VTLQLVRTAMGKGLQIALMAVGAYYFASWLIGPRLDPDFNWAFFAIMFVVGFVGFLMRSRPKP